MFDDLDSPVVVHPLSVVFLAPAQGTAARSAETLGSARQGNGPVAEGDAPPLPPAPPTRNPAEAKKDQPC
ncbi:hypothetical protein ABC766_00035 [Methylobacterium fujisawaense]|uniref:hypothetical protein n=1 Tax=Methylobacterium fujisawaense TaxID=107400 RepID=UPI0031F5B9A9